MRTFAEKNRAVIALSGESAHFAADLELLEKQRPGMTLIADAHRANRFNTDTIHKKIIYALLDDFSSEEILENRTPKIQPALPAPEFIGTVDLIEEQTEERKIAQEEEIRDEIREEVREELKDELHEEIREELKEELEEEIREELKEELQTTTAETSKKKASTRSSRK